jgi:hypothetical protein
MSLFSDLTHIVQDLSKIAMFEVSAELIPLEIAQALSNAITQAVGQAVQQAVQQLESQMGLPGFLARDIQRLVNDIMRELHNPTNPVAYSCVNQQFGNQINNFSQHLTQSITQGMLQNNASWFGGGCKGSGGWLMALAAILGKLENQQAQKLQQMSNAVQNNNNPGQVTQLSAQAELFGMMMNAFSNVIKTIGEALSSMASKQ